MYARSYMLHDMVLFFMILYLAFVSVSVSLSLCNALGKCMPTAAKHRTKLFPTNLLVTQSKTFAVWNSVLL